MSEHAYTKEVRMIDSFKKSFVAAWTEPTTIGHQVASWPQSRSYEAVVNRVAGEAVWAKCSRSRRRQDEGESEEGPQRRREHPEVEEL